jgi:ADP-ribose pyrophosphatase
VNGIGILAVISRSGEEFIVVIKEYRAPVDRFILSLAAGMMDPDETDARDTAIRELKEETGYSCVLDDVTDVSPVVYTDPHKSTECMRWISLSVNADAPENANPKAKL